MPSVFKPFVLFVASILFVLSACKKKEIINTHPNDSGTNRVKTLHFTDYSRVYGMHDWPIQTHIYDNQSRLVTIASNIDTASFTYGSNTIMVYDNSPSNFISDTFTVFLNAQGLMDSVTGRDNTSFGDGYGTLGTSHFKYTYNADGQLIQEITTLGTDNYTWSNGDMVISGVTYSTLPDKREYGDAAFGKHPQHLISSSVSGSWTTNYIFQLDLLGRVTRETQVMTNPGVSQADSTVRVYTYY